VSQFFIVILQFLFSCFVADAEEGLKRLQSVSLDEISGPQHVTEDLNVDPESDPVYFLCILVESLAMLKRMPEAVDVSSFTT
jgi:hypothetical protein